MKNLRNLGRKYGSKALAIAALATMTGAASAAEGGNPIVELLGGISLSGVAAAVMAVCVVVVAIALTMKGPDVAKRVIRKV